MATRKGKRTPAAASREPRTMEAAQAAYRNRKQQVWDKGKEKLDKALKASKGHSPARLGVLGQYSRIGYYRAYGVVYIRNHARNAVYNLPAEVLGRRLAALGRGSREVVAGSVEHGARYRLEYQRPCPGGDMISEEAQIFRLGSDKALFMVRKDLAFEIYRAHKCEGMLFKKIELYGEEFRTTPPDYST